MFLYPATYAAISPRCLTSCGGWLRSQCSIPDREVPTMIPLVPSKANDVHISDIVIDVTGSPVDVRTSIAFPWRRIIRSVVLTTSLICPIPLFKKIRLSFRVIEFIWPRMIESPSFTVNVAPSRLSSDEVHLSSFTFQLPPLVDTQKPDVPESTPIPSCRNPVSLRTAEGEGIQYSFVSDPKKSPRFVSRGYSPKFPTISSPTLSCHSFFFEVRSKPSIPPSPLTRTKVESDCI